MKKALRVGYNRYYDDDIFAEHLKYIKDNIDVIDEVTLFAEFSHYGYWSPEFSQKNADIIQKRTKEYKSAGIKRVGINLLSTIGHIEEGWGVFPKAPFQYQVSKEGIESKACLCPTSDGFLDYVKKRYAIYAKTDADFIWSDDDLRPGHHGVAKEFCFCDGCISKFNSRYGTCLTREELADKIYSDPQIKASFEEFKNNAIDRIYLAIKEAVSEANPSMEIGFMPCSTTCAPTKRILESGSVMFRPGGVFYSEEQPNIVFHKSFAVQQQIRNAPRFIKDIQYEYEAFNYQPLERSMRFTEFETSLALMSGCNGVLYNNDIFNDRTDITDMLRASKSKWNTLVKLNADNTPCGVYCTDLLTSRLLNQIGIATTPYPENAAAAVVVGAQLELLSDREISVVLDKNLLTDGRGLEVLHSRGFGGLCGGTVKNSYDCGMAERFSQHRFNGSFKNYYRDVFMNFYYESNAYELEASENAEIVSSLETITHKPLSCSMYIYEREDGTRFAADGYLMLNSGKSPAKREQLNNVLSWLSHKTLPVKINKAVKVVPTVTTDAADGMNIMLTNVSFDKTGVFECAVNSTKQFSVIGQNGSLIPARQEVINDRSIITIDNLDRWDYILLTNKQ